MKKLVLASISLFLVNNCEAKPWHDFLVGGIMLATGGVFEMQRSKEASDKEGAETSANQHSVAFAGAYQNFWYFAGAADWERTTNGNTAAFNTLANTAIGYSVTANRELAAFNSDNSSANEHRNKEKVYKGVSLTAFGVGSAFVVKGLITYLVQRNYEKTAWLDNLELTPNYAMDGATLRYRVRI